MNSRMPRLKTPRRIEVPFLNRMWVKLVLVSSTLLILAIGFTASLIMRLTSEQMRREITGKNLQIARRASEEISAFMRNARHDLLEIAGSLELVDRMPWVRTVVLANRVISSAIFDIVILTDGDGRVLADNRLPPAAPFEVPAGAIAHARKSIDWTSPVEIDERGIPSMTLAVSAGRGNALVARLSLEKIWRIMDDIDAGTGGFAYLLSSEGRLIAHPDKVLVLGANARLSPESPAQKNSLLVSSTVSDPGWTVYIQQPFAEAYSTIFLVLRQSVVLAVFVLIMATLIGVLTVRFFSLPLDALLLGTVKIREGDLGHRIPLATRDEFGALSRSFNEMVGALRERTLALEDSETRYRQVTESVNDIIFTVDSRGMIVFVNSRAEQLLGYPIRQIIGGRYLDFISPAFREREQKKFEARRNANWVETFKGEAPAVSRTGEELILEFESVPRKEASGETLIHGVARDVTLRKKMEERLRRSEKLSALGQIISGVAHELRNAVSAVAASMEMARARHGGDGASGGGSGSNGHAQDRRGDATEDLDRALSEAQRAQRIVQGLLSSSAEHAAAAKPCALNETIAACVDMRREDLRKSGITVELDLDPALPPVMADPIRLQQVFLNLIDNAHHAMIMDSPGGAGAPGKRRLLSIGTRAAANVVEAKVSDTGRGIPPAHIGKIFDPFFTTKKEIGGTGLGLAVSLGIVEAIGGEIRARSIEGEGSTFTVEIPAAGQPGSNTPSLTRDAQDPDMAGSEILLVEDESSVRDFIHHCLRSLGCRVSSVRNGAEAVTFLGTGNPCSLVISDYRMPDKDGRDLYNWILANRPELVERLIYITGDSRNPVTRAFFNETRVPYLLKPVAVSMLVKEVTRCLRADGGRACGGSADAGSTFMGLPADNPV